MVSQVSKSRANTLCLARKSHLTHNTIYPLTSCSSTVLTPEGTPRVRDAWFATMASRALCVANGFSHTIPPSSRYFFSTTLPPHYYTSLHTTPPIVPYIPNRMDIDYTWFHRQAAPDHVSGSKPHKTRQISALRNYRLYRYK